MRRPRRERIDGVGGREFPRLGEGRGQTDRAEAQAVCERRHGEKEPVST